MALPAAVTRVGVIGNGIIGHGVAQVFAMAGIGVVMIGRREASLAAAREKIRASLGDFAAHGLIQDGDLKACWPASEPPLSSKMPRVPILS